MVRIRSAPPSRQRTGAVGRLRQQSLLEAATPRPVSSDLTSNLQAVRALPEDLVFFQADVQHVLAVNRTQGLASLVSSITSSWAMSAMKRTLLADGISRSATIDLSSTLTHQ